MFSGCYPHFLSSKLAVIAANVAWVRRVRQTWVLAAVKAPSKCFRKAAALQTSRSIIFSASPWESGKFYTDVKKQEVKTLTTESPTPNVQAQHVTTCECQHSSSENSVAVTEQNWKLPNLRDNFTRDTPVQFLQFMQLLRHLLSDLQ